MDPGASRFGFAATQRFFDHGRAIISTMAGRLILCATPIGNLGDISSRLVEALDGADHIYAEDTRRTGQLLNHLGLGTPMTSFFSGNEQARLPGLADRLHAGEVVCLVSDAGTPVVSDPGASAVDVAVAAGADVTVVPGPSAVTAALALSGFDGDRFCFEGFLPRKGGDRAKTLERVAGEQRTVVLFAAPSRVAKDLADLAVSDPDRRVVVARELTKLHEEVWRGSVGAAATEFSEPARARGEFTIVIEAVEAPEPSIDEAVSDALGLIAEGVTTSDAVRRVAEQRGVSRRRLYELVLRAK